MGTAIDNGMVLREKGKQVTLHRTVQASLYAIGLRITKGNVAEDQQATC